MPPPEWLDWSTLMRRGVVQQNDHRTGQMAEQFTQEQADLLLPDVVVEEQIVKIQTSSRREGLSEMPEMTLILSRRPWR